MPFKRKRKESNLTEGKGKLYQFLHEKYKFQSDCKNQQCKIGHVILAYIEYKQSRVQTIKAIQSSFGIILTNTQVKSQFENKDL